ncbi:MAG: hypothetical protein H9535_08195 [Ignavibacteria bacterium]|nr:hypothetical protein [Ignavibacteria bacterium]
MESIHQDFIAWSLYTGPSNMAFMQNPNLWITGIWNGGKQHSSDSAQGLKADLDERINLIVKVFERAVPMYTTSDRHFVLPEFFFHCGHGPYPLVVEGVDGDEIDAFQYMIDHLSERFEQCIKSIDPDDNNCYNIVIGSMLTSNQINYDEFLQSKQVNDRKNELDKILTLFQYRVIFLVSVSFLLLSQLDKLNQPNLSSEVKPGNIQELIGEYEEGVHQLPTGLTFDDILPPEWKDLFLGSTDDMPNMDLSDSNLLTALKNFYGQDTNQSSNVQWERNRRTVTKSNGQPFLSMTTKKDGRTNKDKAEDANKETNENSKPAERFIKLLVNLDAYRQAIEADYQFEISKFMDQNKTNPLCTVRNRGAYFYFRKCTIPGETTPKRRMQVFRYEKQNDSSIDLTMGSHIDTSQPECTLVLGDVIAEWMCNYPAYSLYWGDKNVPLNFHPSDNYQYAARFTPFGVSGVDFGVELCLDHGCQRLRRTVEMSSSNILYNSVQNYPLCKQLITSCGSQIQSFSVAADSNSVVFHADGGEAMVENIDGNNGNWSGNAKTIGNTKINKGIFCDVYSLYASSAWEDASGKRYFSHSQLAFTTDNSSVNGFNNAGTDNNTATTYNGTTENPSNRLTDRYEVQVLPLKTDTEADGDKPFSDMGDVFEGSQWLFAAGVGELHHYRPIIR